MSRGGIARSRLAMTKCTVIIGLDPIISCEDSRVCVRLTAYLHGNDKCTKKQSGAFALRFLSVFYIFKSYSLFAVLFLPFTVAFAFAISASHFEAKSL